MQSPILSSVVEEVVLVNTDPVPGADLAQEASGGTAGIVPGLLLIFVAIIIGTANLVGARRSGQWARHRWDSPPVVARTPNEEDQRRPADGRAGDRSPVEATGHDAGAHLTVAELARSGR